MNYLSAASITKQKTYTIVTDCEKTNANANKTIILGRRTSMDTVHY